MSAAARKSRGEIRAGRPNIGVQRRANRVLCNAGLGATGLRAFFESGADRTISYRGV